MVNNTAYAAAAPRTILANHSRSLSEDTCAAVDDGDAAESGYKGTFLWDPNMQSNLVSATAYGAMITILPAGYLADRFGPRFMLLTSSVIIASATLLTPFLAVFNFYALFVTRVIMGFAFGFAIPPVSSLAARWFPAEERSSLLALVTSGLQLSMTLGGVISSSLCQLESLGGWKLIFYLFGALSLTWCVIWYIISSNGPNSSKWISDEERIYIMASMPQKNAVSRKVPWCSILTSLAVHSVLLVQFSFAFVATIIQFYLPAFFRDVLHLPLKYNGLCSMLPFFCELMFKNVFAMIADYLKRHNVLSDTVVVKIFQAIGSYGTALSMVGIALFVDCHRIWLAILLLACHGMCFSAGVSGSFTSSLSIAPRFAGVISSLCMFWGMLAAGTAPSVFAYVNPFGTSDDWSTVFLICAFIYVSFGTLFMVCGSAEVQPWARPKQKVSTVIPISVEVEVTVR
uniref:MFS domain-containing protein n=1 Tax=Steinernema glaseri TaxID=37863 RepID=A0A1I7XWY5_9BILA